MKQLKNNGPVIFIPAAFTLLYSIINGLFTGFLPTQTAVDYWGVQFISSRLFDNIPQSLYNGFFPSGYCLFLKPFISIMHPAIAGYLINTAFVFLLFLIVTVFARRILDPFWVSIYLLFLFLFPRMYQYMFTAGADMGAVLFFTGGVLFIWLPLFFRTEKKNSTRLFIAGGAFLGLAALWRYHAFVAGVMILFYTFIFFRNNSKGVIISGVVFLLAYLPQMIISMATGHGPLETSHELNIYNLMYKVNWYRVSGLDLDKNILSLIMENPLLFVKKYIPGVLKLSLLSLPSLFLVSLLKNGKIRKMNIIWLLFSLSYSLVFGISASSRAPLLLVPITLMFLTACYKHIYSSIKGKNVAFFRKYSQPLYIAFILSQVFFFLYKDTIKTVVQRERNIRYKKIEQTLKDHGVSSARQVFTTYFHFYFRSVDPFRPLHNGGWVRIETFGYDRYFPRLDVGSEKSFREDCLSKNVGFLLLSPSCGELQGFFDKIYRGEESGYRHVGDFDELKIFKIK